MALNIAHVVRCSTVTQCKIELTTSNSTKTTVNCTLLHDESTTATLFYDYSILGKIDDDLQCKPWILKSKWMEGDIKLHLSS